MESGGRIESKMVPIKMLTLTFVFDFHTRHSPILHRFGTMQIAIYVSPERLEDRSFTVAGHRTIIMPCVGMSCGHKMVTHVTGQNIYVRTISACLMSPLVVSDEI